MLERLSHLKEEAVLRWQSIDRGQKIKAAGFSGVLSLVGVGLFALGQRDVEPARSSTEALINEPNPTTIPPVREVVHFYTVKAGDTLTTIAETCGMTVGDIQALNGIIDPNLIYANQQLQVSCDPEAAGVKTESITRSEPLTMEDASMAVVPQGESLSDTVEASQSEIDASPEGQLRWETNRQFAENLGGPDFLAWLLGQAPAEDPNAVLSWMSAENGEVYITGMYGIYVAELQARYQQ